MLFELPQVKRLFFIGGFCTVTRDGEAPWPDLQNEIGRRLQAYFAHGGTAFEAPPVDPAQYTETEQQIVRILDEVIRPAVQRDGGDIAFAGYEDGVVQLYMLGSCVGCPSSLATLKMGVENLLKDQVPGVKEVVAI
jgi:Fe-S cluster biogenesis protein NfuA